MVGDKKPPEEGQYMPLRVLSICGVSASGKDRLIDRFVKGAGAFLRN